MSVTSSWSSRRSFPSRPQVASAIDLVVQMTRFNDGRRGLTQISEVLPLGDDGRYRLQEMFEYKLADGPGAKAGAGELAWMGKNSTFAREPKIRILRDKWNLTKEVFDKQE